MSHPPTLSRHAISVLAGTFFTVGRRAHVGSEPPRVYTEAVVFEAAHGLIDGSFGATTVLWYARRNVGRLKCRRSDGRGSSRLMPRSPTPPRPPSLAPHDNLSSGTHKYLIGVASLSDVAGSEGLLMEMAVCDLYQACLKKSDPEFGFEQLIK